MRGDPRTPGPGRLSRKLSSFRDKVTLRSRRSWTRWRQKSLLRRMKREQRLLETLRLQVLRQREKLAELERRATPQVLVIPEPSPEQLEEMRRQLETGSPRMWQVSEPSQAQMEQVPPPGWEPMEEPEETEPPPDPLEEVSRRLGLTQPPTSSR